MGNSTTKSLSKPYIFEKKQTVINQTINDNQLAMYSIDEQKEIQELRQQLDKDIKEETTHLFLQSIELDKQCIINLILKLVKNNIEKKANYDTANLIKEKMNSISITKKRYLSISYISNGVIIEKQILTYRNQIIDELSTYVFKLKKHFGDEVSYILQEHFDLTDIYHNILIKYKKPTLNLKKNNWSVLSSNDTNMIYEYYILQNSLKEWNSVVKPHPNKKGHVIFNANYLKNKK